MDTKTTTDTETAGEFWTVELGILADYGHASVAERIRAAIEAARLAVADLDAVAEEAGLAASVARDEARWNEATRLLDACATLGRALRTAAQ